MGEGLEKLAVDFVDGCLSYGGLKLGGKGSRGQSGLVRRERKLFSCKITEWNFKILKIGKCFCRCPA